MQDLENPRDCGAWWAAVYGVAQSRTRLKRLSSSGGGSSQSLSWNRAWGRGWETVLGSLDATPKVP